MNWKKIPPVVLSPFPHTCVDRPELACDACEWAEEWKKKPSASVGVQQEVLTASSGL